MKNRLDSNDAMLTLMEGWILGQMGRDPSEAIEHQEARGQREVVRHQRLPKKVNSHALPNEVFFKGVTNEMSYEQHKEITDKNLTEYTLAQYAQMGIKIISEYDDLFVTVELPTGWEIKATDHTMWNDLIDNNGRLRAKFFYKAAFYDRDAFINFETRYKVEATHVAPWDADYEVWKKSDYHGIVKDGDTVIFETIHIPATEDYDLDRKIEEGLYDKATAYLKENFPDYKNIHAYWDN